MNINLKYKHDIYIYKKKWNLFNQVAELLQSFNYNKFVKKIGCIEKILIRIHQLS